MRLRCASKSEILKWSKKYKPDEEKYKLEEKLIEIEPTVKQRRYLNRDELKILVEWKSKRRYELVKDNNDGDIKYITKCAFRVKDERARIEVLTCLRGVAFPIASAILHFFHEDPYPILDFRAPWSIGFYEKEIKYSFKFWERYMKRCRKLASDNGIECMRTLDRALWQYSYKKQKSS